MSKHKVFVYGTLRDGAKATHVLKGFRMFLVQGRKGFQFPFVQQTDGVGNDDEPWYQVYGNIVELTDEELAQADQYENIQSGLYVRELHHVYVIGSRKGIKAWVYVGGPGLVYQPIDNGDWFNR